MTQLGPQDGQVSRRKVFYLPGFDPVPPRKYREIYRREGAAQAEISGYDIQLVKRTDRSRPGWAVAAQIDGRAVHTDVEVLQWSDIVQKSMSGGLLDTYVQLVQTAWIYIGSGALFRLMLLRKGPVIAALYPVAVLLGQLAVALLAASLAGWPLSLIHPLLPFLGLLAVPPMLMWFRKQDRRVMAWYLMHDYAFTALSGGRSPPELAQRIADLEDSIADALREEWDEVLVVGHSSGAHLAVEVLAGLIRAGRVPEDGATLSLLTLGQVIPMVSFLPTATALRRDLRFLSERDELAWVDVTAPGDGCAFALCDPVSVSGVATKAKKWPLVISAAFTKTLSPEKWQDLRWKFFRLHFQYLHAFDRPGVYDYFRITAGPETLALRFSDAQPSKKRIERAVSRYTSRAA